MSHSPRVAALLRAGRAERPPEGTEERLLEGLGVGVGAASSISLAGATVRTWLRWMGLGLLVGAASIPSAWAIGASRPELVEEADAGTIKRDDPPALAPVTLVGRSLVERASPTPPVVLAVHGRVVAPSADDELTPIRDAKIALQHGDAGAALSDLDAHARSFPRGVFQEEAAALRVEALVAAGRPGDARRAADAFDAAYPRSPYGSRVRRTRSQGASW